ncbi:helix-turn-helix domain-containing protein [Streptomyces spectabilis]|uniref:Helix-turn-helix domain-containing protein n=1 Tax=Streptomyces spectabilis TaxID=68270 RepID=A0A516RC99_STRST|nr:helix-turn-helix domain-containing protein [Streptomyces spectabilis]
MDARASAWQPLPAELPSEVRHFVELLRRLKDRTGLSLVGLGERTSYSKSSWQRYLNARQPPPPQAVLALCRVAGADAARLLAARDLAVRAWPRGGTAPAPGPERTAAPVAAGARPPPSWRLVACSALAVVVLLLVSLLWIVSRLTVARDEGRPGAEWGSGAGRPVPGSVERLVRGLPPLAGDLHVVRAADALEGDVVPVAEEEDLAVRLGA